MDTATTHEVDARGLNCPLPILRVRKALNGLEQGEEVRLLATDPGSVKDIEAFCSQTGNELVDSAQSDSGFSFTIRKR